MGNQKDFKNSNFSFCFIVCFFFLCTGLFGQWSITQYIPEANTDSIYIADSSPYPIIFAGNQPFVFDGKKVTIPENEFQINQESPSFFFDSTLHSFAPYQDGFLLGLGNSLSIFKDGVVKEFSVMFSDQKGIVKNICPCGDDFMINAEGKLWIWDNEAYDFIPIVLDKPITSIANRCDRWGIYWASDGSILYAIGQRSEQQLPFLQSRVVYPVDRLPINQKIAPGRELLLESRAFYPLVKNIIHEYKVNTDNEWKPLPPNGEQLLQFEETGIYEIATRAGHNNTYFNYANPVKIKIEEKSWNILYLILIPAGIVLLSGIFIWREQNYKNRIAEVKQKHALKEEINLWKYQSQQLQMNPHFIFNALNTIQGLITIGDNSNARKYLQKFSAIMRTMLSQGDKTSISLEEEIEYLTNYLDMEKVCRNNTFEYVVNNQVKEDIDIPPMLIQPLVENAIIHGFKGIDYSGKLELHFTNDAHYLHCSIKDNGIGRGEAKKKMIHKNHQSKATQIIINRLHTVSKFYKGHLSFHDLLKEDNTSAGTEVNIKIPIL